MGTGCSDHQEGLRASRMRSGDVNRAVSARVSCIVSPVPRCPRPPDSLPSPPAVAWRGQAKLKEKTLTLGVRPHRLLSFLAL